MTINSSEILLDEEYAEYLTMYDSLITEPSKIRKIYFDFESKKNEAAKYLGMSLRLLGFEVSRDEDMKINHARKEIIYADAISCINDAIRAAKEHSAEIIIFLVETDIRASLAKDFYEERKTK
jgi:hypothetical protein